jgi:hypothetical protein
VVAAHFLSLQSGLATLTIPALRNQASRNFKAIFNMSQPKDVPLFSEKTDGWVFRSNPDALQLVRGLHGTFEITWASERVAYGTKIICLILKPSPDLKETFGFDREIALFITRFPSLQPRTFQAIDQFCHESPMHERIDPSVVFLNSPDHALSEKISKQQSEYPQSRMLVGFDDSALRAAINDKWAIKNIISQSLFIRNLFNYKLPIQPNQYFYGREQVVASLVDSVRKCQNGGLFGLRKTGKTSVLLRVQKVLNGDQSTLAIFLDCKRRNIRNLTCDGLIKVIVKKIDEANGTNFSRMFNNDLDLIEVFETTIRAIKKNSRICLIFDEIEYISPISPTDEQWKKEFVDFWQAVWSIQSETQKICFIVCGVNPSVTEIDRFESINGNGKTVQNPMFGIVDVQYLRGFDFDSLARMVKFFGRRMGLVFSQEAIEYVFERFGGHPLLSRLACSFYHESLLARGVSRPIEISRSIEKQMELECDAEISSYCEHVVSEVREFYPAEFELLSLAARGEAEEFWTKARTGRSLVHIHNYGLISRDVGVRPRVEIPVLEEYLRDDYRRINGESFYRKAMLADDRSNWVDRRTRSIEEDFCILNSELRDIGEFDLFPGGALGKISEFLRVSEVRCQEDLVAFLIVSNKTFVENIETHFRKSGQKYYEIFAEGFPNLFDALERLKVYRHSVGHLSLTDDWQERFERRLLSDFGPHGRTLVANDAFWIQRVVLEGIHVALQRETSRY